MDSDDVIADLERQLRDAARREPRPSLRPAPRAAGPILAVAAFVVLAALFVSPIGDDDRAPATQAARTVAVVDAGGGPVRTRRVARRLQGVGTVLRARADGVLVGPAVTVLDRGGADRALARAVRRALDEPPFDDPLRGRFSLESNVTRWLDGAPADVRAAAVLVVVGERRSGTPESPPAGSPPVPSATPEPQAPARGASPTPTPAASAGGAAGGS